MGIDYVEPWGSGPTGLVDHRAAEHPVWDMESADHECECPGPPPPHFSVPPPPRPPFLLEQDCSELPLSDLETCEAVPVIDAEYHSSPAIPSLAIIVIIVLAVVALLSVVTILVVWKRKKMQNLLPRKSSPANHCDPSAGNNVVYEDLPTLRARPLPHCPPRHSALSSIEMMDMNRYPNRAFSPVFICPPSVPDAYASQDMFNPVYEELSNGSGERGETDSEGLPNGRLSEDEFAEDELSLGGEVIPPGAEDRRFGASSLQGSTGNDVCRDVDSSDADDRCRFLVQGGRNSSLPPGYRDKDRRVARGKTSSQRPKSLDRRRGWRSKGPPAAPTPHHPNEFHEGFLLDTLLTMYPRPPPAHPRQEIFTTFRTAHSGSDSGYSYNTSGGRTSMRGRKDLVS